ncbi:GDP-L-fucose synthase [Pasteurellaceae bacterium Orientalotternb1]|nr:GDP-L-fucose synthase [Pasteurellaceae bacterium Orientalotternb1]
MKSIAIIGLGWLGMPLAERLLEKGWHVKGSKRQAAHHPKIEIYPFDLSDFSSENLQPLLNVDAVVINIPPNKTSTENYLDGTKRLVQQAISQQVKQLIFISTTGVLPLQAGTFDESFATVRSTPTALLEQWLQQQPIACDILRLGGLVGKNRHPVHSLAGKQNLSGAGQPVNLVHQHDCVRAIELLLATSNGQRLFHLVAPQHPTRQDYYGAMAKKFGLPDLQFSPENQPLVRIISGENICRELGFEYLYPDPFSF